MGSTLATHSIITTHGSWVHGDVRGSWKNGHLIGADPFLEETIRASMSDDSVVLSPVEVMHVGAVFGQIVLEHRHRVYAATIQPTHLHIIFGPLNEDIKSVVARLKRRTAAAILDLRRKTTNTSPRNLWTEGQYPVFIFDESHLINAIEYVRNHNLRAGSAAEPWDWIEPPDWIANRLQFTGSR